jgi:hypothetical protein
MSSSELIGSSPKFRDSPALPIRGICGIHGINAIRGTRPQCIPSVTIIIKHLRMADVLLSLDRGLGGLENE